MFRSQGEDLHHHHNLFSSSYPPRPNIHVNVTDHHHHNRSRWKPNVEIAPNCPRCNSSNTKFCYYNNYSLTQPRYFCKGCRRYWTKGGSLRNVPIGGGCRKSRRGKTVRSSSLSTASTSYGVAGHIGSSSSSGISLDDDDQNPNVNGRSSTNCTTTTTTSSTNPSLRSPHEPSTIDLALVYAKFLNHEQEPPDNSNNIPHDQHVMPEFCREFDSSIGLSNISEASNLNAHVQFSQEQANDCGSGGSGGTCGGGVGCCGVSDLASDTQFSEGNQQVILLNEFDLNYEQQQQQQQQQIVQERISESTVFETCSYGVQPLLPPQELMGQDLFWSNSPLMGSSSFAWQATQLQDFEPVPDDNSTIPSSPLDENWSPFDLPSFEAFSRP